MAEQILSHIVNEREVWRRLFSSGDDRIVLESMKFLVSMRDGKPAQRINVTSTNINLTSRDIQSARDIVAEIRAGMVTSALESDTASSCSGLPHPTSDTRELGSGGATVASKGGTIERSGSSTTGIMLRDDEGGKNGGS